MTNINITYEDKSFIYAIDYIRIKDSIEKQFKYSVEKQNISFETDLFRTNNAWKISSSIHDNSCNLNRYAKLRLYFPQHSPEIYSDLIRYALDAYIYINDTKVILGSFLLDRCNSLAAPKVLKFQGQEYYECIDLDIIDPYDIIYSDEFHDFRKSIKGFEDYELNDDGTSLYISLNPIEYDGESFIVDDRFNGGQNAITISDNLNDFLNYSISWEDCSIKCNINFNPVYGNDLYEYLKTTYYWDDNVAVKYLLTLNKLSPSILEGYEQSGKYVFEHNEIKNGIKCLIESSTGFDMVNFFDDWNLWESGISFVSTAILYNIETGEEKMILKSNPIPISQDIYSKLIVKQEKIDLTDMNINNINITNTVTNKNIKHSIPDSSKSNIILPVFYRVRELGNVVLHPEVNENICINLDAYKSKVETFIMQVEGIKFSEIGTTGAGTIFKIIGNMLPGSIKSGTYYILSQSGDLVTTGKYTYEY